MTKDVADYCNDYLRCKRATVAKYKPYGLLAPSPPLNTAWDKVTFDFITKLPPSKVSGVVYDAIMVVVCRLTKIAYYVLAQIDWDGVDLA
jgi:hypothetical protein